MSNKVCETCRFFDNRICANDSAEVGFIENPKTFGCTYWKAREIRESFDIIEGFMKWLTTRKRMRLLKGLREYGTDCTQEFRKFIKEYLEK